MVQEMLDWKLKTRGQLPIGLDIGDNFIKMIQLAVSDGHISVLAAKKLRIDQSLADDAEQRSSAIVSVIQQALAEGGFRGKTAISSLPNDHVRITSLRLGENESDKLEQTLKNEAGQRFGMDPNKDSIRYMPAGDVPQGDEVKNELILFAVASESIKEHIQLLEDAGLQPVGIDAVPCALFRSYERSMQRQEDQQRAVVFVDVGSRFTTVVLGRGQEITFVKQIALGGRDFNREIAAKLGISGDEAEMLRNKLRMERAVTDQANGSGRYRAEPIGQDDTAEPTGQDAAEPIGQDGAAEAISQNDAAEPIGQNDAAEAISQDDAGEPIDQNDTAESQTGRQPSVLDPGTRQVIVDAISSIAEKLANEISLCFRYYTVTFRGKRVERAVFSGGEAYEEILLNVLRRHLAVEIEVAQPMRGFDVTKLSLDSDRRSTLCEWAVAVGLSLKGRNGDGRARRISRTGDSSVHEVDSYEGN